MDLLIKFLQFSISQQLRPSLDQFRFILENRDNIRSFNYYHLRCINIHDRREEKNTYDA